MVEELDREWEARMLLRLPAVQEWVARAEQQAEERGEQRGERRGERRGEKRGEQNAIAALLGRLFARRLGRRPTAEEEQSMVERARAIGPVEVEDALLDLETDALLRWLTEPVHRP